MNSVPVLLNFWKLSTLHCPTICLHAFSLRLLCWYEYSPRYLPALGQPHSTPASKLENFFTHDAWVKKPQQILPELLTEHQHSWNAEVALLGCSYQQLQHSISGQCFTGYQCKQKLVNIMLRGDALGSSSQGTGTAHIYCQLARKNS